MSFKIDINKIGELSKRLDDIFESRLNNVFEIDARRVSSEAQIQNNGLFISKGPDAELISFILGTWNESGNNLPQFVVNLRRKLTMMSRYNSELAKLVRENLAKPDNEFGPEESFSIFASLHTAFEERMEREFIVGFLKTPPHPTQIRKALDSLKNKKFAAGLKKIIRDLANEEVAYLTRYDAELLAWGQGELLKNGIQYFIQRANAMFYGQVEPYLGVISIFNDEKAKGLLYQNHAFLHLVRYNLLLLYVRNLIKQVQTFETGDWTQFNQFFKNVEKIAAKLRKEFGIRGTKETGVEGLGDRMIKTKGELRQYPVGWVKFLQYELAVLESDNYKRNNVVLPFINEITHIFEQRITEINSERKSELNDLRIKIDSLIKARNESLSIAGQNILRMITKTKNDLIGKARKLRREFSTLSDRCADQMQSFYEAKTRIIDQEMRMSLLKKLKIASKGIKIAKYYREYLVKVAGNNLENIPADSKRFLALLYAADRIGSSFGAFSDNMQAILSMLSDDKTIAKVGMIDSELRRVEHTYAKIEDFMNSKLAFLVQQPKKQEEVTQDERRKAA